MLRILSLLCFFLFGACKSTPSRWDEKPFSSRTGEGDIIAWKTSPGKKDSGTDISLSVDGHPHLVVNGAASFARMTPGEYESKGVPTEAIAADHRLQRIRRPRGRSRYAVDCDAHHRLVAESLEPLRPSKFTKSFHSNRRLCASELR